MTTQNSALERAQRLTAASGGDVTHAGRVLEAIDQDGRRLSSECGHDGWRAGCPRCEREHAAALELIGWEPR